MYFEGLFYCALTYNFVQCVLIVSYTYAFFSVSEGVCLFCKSSADNSQKYGQKLQKEDITVHYFCMVCILTRCQ